MSTTLNVALSGYGYAGKTFHAPLIVSTAGLELVAVVSSDAAKVLADFPGLTVSRTLDELLAATRVDVIVIATPNHSHFELARHALLAGKHVVVDKPFTLTAAQARELNALAAQNKLCLSVFHNRRWDADFLTLRELIASGQLGELTRFESRFDRNRPEVRVRWREQSGDGSGLWYDLGPHLLDQALELFGRPVAVHADFAIQRKHGKTVDYFHVLLRYPRLHVTLHASMLAADESLRYVLTGEAGRYTKSGTDTQEAALKRGELPGAATWGEDPCEGVLTTAQGSSHVPNLRGDYLRFYSGFRDAIQLNTANPVLPEQALLSMELIELAIRSAQSGNELYLS